MVCNSVYFDDAKLRKKSDVCKFFIQLCGETKHIFNISFQYNCINLNSDFRNGNRIINHKQLGGQSSL